MKVALLIGALLLLYPLVVRAQPYTMQYMANWGCMDDRLDTLLDLGNGPESVSVFSVYALYDNGKCYVRFYILCDGRIVQESPPHDDVSTDELAVIGTVSCAPYPYSDPNFHDDFRFQQEPYGIKLTITIWNSLFTNVHDKVLAVITYPAPGFETGVRSHPAQVAYP